MIQEAIDGMNANEKRTFRKLKQKVYSTVTAFYREGNTRLTLQERLLVDYFAGTFSVGLMEALKHVDSKD